MSGLTYSQREAAKSLLKEALQKQIDAAISADTKAAIEAAVKVEQEREVPPLCKEYFELDEQIKALRERQKQIMPDANKEIAWPPSNSLAPSDVTRWRNNNAITVKERMMVGVIPQTLLDQQKDLDRLIDMATSPTALKNLVEAIYTEAKLELTPVMKIALAIKG